MKKIFAFIFALLFSPFAAFSAIEIYEETTEKPEYVEKTVVVKWRDDISVVTANAELAASTHENAALATAENTALLPERDITVVESPTLSTEELIEQFENIPEVEYVHPNFLFYAQAQSTPWGVDDSAGVRAIAAHGDGYTGAGVVVAVLDTGVDLDHEDLDDNLWVNAGEIVDNGIDDDGNGRVDDVNGYDFVSLGDNTDHVPDKEDDNDPTDENGHGTHVSGTIAAEDNGSGVIGVAPDAQIMAVRVLGESGSGSFTDVVEGIDYAVENGADVINMSLGATSALFSEFSVTRIALQDALDDAETAGVTVIAAAGNDSSPIASLPAVHESVISVGSLQETTSQNNPNANFGERLSYFSNWGKNTIVAPGSRIVSTTYDGSTGTYNGTSMATPHVAGVVALLKEKRAALTPFQIRHIIETTATDLGDTGKDEFYGSGLVNAEAALAKTDASSTKTILLEGNWAEDSLSYAEPTVQTLYLPADGSTTTTLRVRVATEDGTPPNPGESVSLAVTSGSVTSTNPATTDSNGFAEFTVQSSATAGDATATATLVSTSDTSSVVLHYADTLLVTDDGQPSSFDNGSWFFFRALEDNGYNWKQSRQGTPANESTMGSYDNVVWHSGRQSVNTDEQARLTTYLDGGGNLFISGGDLLADLGTDNLFEDYLKVTLAADDVADDTLVGDGDFETTGGEVSSSASYSDAMTVADGATVAGYFCSNTENAIATIDSTYDAVVISVTLEQMSKTARDQIIDNAMEFLTGASQSGGTYTVPGECDADAVQPVAAEEPEEEPVEETPEETPEEETPSEEAPNEDTPSEDTPSEDTPSEDTPSEETPEEEADVTVSAVEASENGTVVVSYSDGTSTTISAFPAASTNPRVKLAADGERIAVLNRNGKKLRIYNALTGEQLRSKNLRSKKQTVTRIKTVQKNGKEYVVVATKRGNTIRTTLMRLTSASKLLNTNTKKLTFKKATFRLNIKSSNSRIRIKKQNGQTKRVYKITSGHNLKKVR